MKKLIFLTLFFITACTTPGDIVYKDKVVENKVAVAQPCVVGVRPTPPISLKEQYTLPQWRALSVKQRAALVGLQGLNYKKYGENLNGSTISCP